MRREYDFKGGKRGAVAPVPPGKTRITIRIDDDVLAWFRSQVEKVGGGSYQAAINAALRRFIETSEEPLEDTLRRVLREELAGADKPRAVIAGCEEPERRAQT